MKTSERLYKKRKALSMTQAQLGKIVGVSRSIISEYENDISDPSWEIMMKISKVLGVTLDYLAWGDENEIQG